MENLHAVQTGAGQVQNPLLIHHVEMLVTTLNRFYESGHFSGHARTIHETAFIVSEAMRSGDVDQNRGLGLIYNLTEMQVFICEALEQYKALKGLTSNSVK